jgi:hypothetical protein
MKKTTATPWFVVQADETSVDVYVLPWHVRSVRGVRWKPEDGETLTRIEFADGDALDVAEPVDEVLERVRSSLQAVLDSIPAVGR